MSGTVNRVILIGHLGADPEIKFMTSGNPMCSFRLATSKTWKDKDGNSQARTEWHRIVIWGKQAESCGQYLRKGALAYVEGEIETRKFQDTQGIDRYITEIKARDVRFLGSKPQADSSMAEMGYSTQAKASAPYEDKAMGYDEVQQDVPF